MVICRESPIFATKSTHNMKRSFYFIPVWAVMAFAFLSCGEDRTYEFLAKTEVDNWIEAQMREIYLYYREIPQLETEDYFSPAEEFFPKLLASPGQIFLYRSTHGNGCWRGGKVPQRHSNRNLRFRFRIDRRPDGKFQTSGTRVASVTQSPATAIGLQRGDFITEVNGNNVSSKIPAFWKTGMELYSRFPPFRPTKRPATWFGTMKRQNLHFRLPSTWRTIPSSFTRSSSRTEGKPVIWYIMNSRQA